MNKYEVFDEQYRQNIVLLVGGKEPVMRWITKRENGLPISPAGCKAFDTSIGLCLYLRSGEIVIWLPSFKWCPESLSVLTHEVLHAVVYRASRCCTSKALTHDNIYWVEMVMRKLLEKI